jgi:EpsI family protein
VGAPAPVRGAIVAAMLFAVLALTRLTSSVGASTPADLTSIPASLDEWVATAAPPLDPDVARVLAADLYVHRFYSGRRGVVEMDVAYYAKPRVGANMHSPLNCLPGNGWQVTDVRDAEVTAAGRAWSVRDSVVERRGSRFALTYWFQSRQRIVGNEWATRAYLLSDALQRRPTDAGIVRLMMPVTGDGITERATLSSFAARLIPEIGARLQ